VIVLVRDNGRGFDPAMRSTGFGLVGMRERAELLGGTVEVTSTPGSGTRIRAVLPVTRADAPASQATTLNLRRTSSA
jgi:signal transduction histidine kinase